MSALRARSSLFIPGGGLLLLLIFLSPARHAGLRGDDVWTFQQQGRLELENTSFLGFLADGMQTAVELGRPQFLGGIQGEIFIGLFEGHTTTYHLVLVLLTVAAGGLLYRLVRELGGSASTGLLVLVLLAGAIQFRSYHDAMLGYYGTTQLTLICMLASLLALLHALRGGGRRPYALSLVLYVAACLVNEWAYALAALHVVIALIELRGRAALRRAVPFIAAAGVFTVGAILARGVFAEQVPHGYTVSTSVFSIARSYVVQLFPPLPASNLVLPDNGFRFLPVAGDPTRAELLGGAWRGLAAFVLVLGLALRIDREGPPAARALAAMAAVGAALWLTPVAAIAFAPKYHAELTLAKGYLPVLVQVFGYALVAAAALLGLMRLARARSAVAVRVTAATGAALVGVAAGVVGFNNLRVVASEVPARETRELLEHAAQDGGLVHLAAGATLLFSDRDMSWPVGSWHLGPVGPEAALLTRSGRVFDARLVTANGADFTCPRGDGPVPAECSPLSRERAWVRVRATRDGGTVIVTTFAQDPPLAAPATALRVYARGHAGTPAAPRLVGRTVKGAAWHSGTLAWRRTAAGDGWAIYEASPRGASAPAASTLDDPSGVVDFTAPLSPGLNVRLFGTKGLLP